MRSTHWTHSLAHFPSGSCLMCFAPLSSCKFYPSDTDRYSLSLGTDRQLLSPASPIQLTLSLGRLPTFWQNNFPVFLNSLTLELRELSDNWPCEYFQVPPLHSSLGLFQVSSHHKTDHPCCQSCLFTSHCAHHSSVTELITLLRKRHESLVTGVLATTAAHCLVGEGPW